MTIVARENVEVGDVEIDIIEPHHTPHDRDRVFAVSNGEQEIELKAWGSEDGETWVKKEVLTISVNNSGALTVGPFSYWVKLTGNTTTPGTMSRVDACLVYTFSPYQDQD